MNKCLRMVVCTLLVIVSLQQVAFAGVKKTQEPSKPTEGIESSDPNHGSSRGYTPVSPKSISGFLTQWYSDVYNTGTNLYLECSSTAAYPVDELKTTLYLQQWVNTQWVDINSWTFNRTNTSTLMGDSYANYQSGNYYRVRSVHYAKDGIQEETQNATSTYIYINQ